MSELEPAPDQALSKALGREIFALIVAHVNQWGAGNKPRVEAAAALGFAFGGLLEQHSDEDCQLFTRVLLLTAKGWSDELKESRGL